MNNFCTFYIVRHGQTEWNVEGKLQGHSDSPLTKEGIFQAQNTAKMLQKISFDAIFSSDLLRAQKTAEIIKLDRELEVITTELLRERSYGPFEGSSTKGKFMQEFDEALEKLGEAEKHSYKHHPEIESSEEVAIRLITFIREIATRLADKRVLLVSHGGIMRAFLIHIGFGNSKTLPHGAVSNAAAIILRSDGTDFEVVKTVGIEKKQA